MLNAIHTHRKLMLLLALLVAVSMAGCGVDSAPLAPDEGAVPQPAAKKVKKDKKEKEPSNTNQIDQTGMSDKDKVMGEREIIRNIPKKGGKITVQEDRLKITFRVAKNALQETTPIEMKVKGETVSDLEIEFGPDGLVFEKPCELNVKLSGWRVDADFADLKTKHIHADGTVNQAGIISFSIDDAGDIHMKVEVPGFSRYRITRY